MRINQLLPIALLGLTTAAAQPCSVGDTRGTYLLKYWGWHDLGPSHPMLPNTMGPTYGLGIVTLDGAGKGSGRFNVTFGGLVRSFEYAEFTYTVNDDCGGTASYRLRTPEGVWGSDKLELRVLDDGARIRGQVMETDGRGAMMVSEFRRLGRGPRVCHASMIRGSYSLSYDGWVNLKTLNPAAGAAFSPAQGIGMFTVDPEGTNRGIAQHNWGGMQLTGELISGAWNVNADCTGVFEYVMQIRGMPNRLSGQNAFVLSGDGAAMTVLMKETPAFYHYERVSIP